MWVSIYTNLTYKLHNTCLQGVLNAEVTKLLSFSALASSGHLSLFLLFKVQYRQWQLKFGDPYDMYLWSVVVMGKSLSSAEGYVKERVSAFMREAPAAVHCMRRLVRFGRPVRKSALIFYLPVVTTCWKSFYEVQCELRCANSDRLWAVIFWPFSQNFLSSCLLVLAW